MTTKTNIINTILLVITVSCCLLSLVLVPLGISIGRKLFYLSGYTSFIGLIITIIKSRANIKNENIIISVSILIFSLVSIIWILFTKPEYDYSPIYSIYMHTGKILITSSIIYLYLSSNNVKFNISLFILLINIIINYYAFYQHFYLGIDRAELGTEKATIAAYIISIIGSLALSTILISTYKYKLYIAAAFFSFSFSAIVLTQTRAAIIIFPILTLLTMLMNKQISRILTIKFFSILILLLLGLSFIFKSTLENRYNDISSDISLYYNSNSNSSIGARFAMFIVGIQTGSENILGQSAENRTREIKKIANIDKSLSGAVMYTDIHLHNEIIDNFSLKGIFGIISILGLYIALIYRSFSNGLNIPMLIITLSTIIYGLTDVLFFSKEFTMTLFLCLFMSLITVKKLDEANIK